MLLQARDQSTVAKVGIPLHHLEEGEVLDGWFALREAGTTARETADIVPKRRSRVPGLFDRCARAHATVNNGVTRPLHSVPAVSYRARVP